MDWTTILDKSLSVTSTDQQQQNYNLHIDYDINFSARVLSENEVLAVVYSVLSYRINDSAGSNKSKGTNDWSRKIVLTI